MRVCTTCATCEELMIVADPTAWHQPRAHPTCAEPVTPLDVLAAAWAACVARDDDDTAMQMGMVLDAPPAPPRLREAALDYARRGWSVFPLLPGGKQPLTRHGFKDATTDPATIEHWWAGNPQANIGLPTGAVFDVIDVDAPHGWRSLWAADDADALPVIHGVVSTAGAGLHLYIQPTGDPNGAGILPGHDFRGAGGYVVAPPSVTADGSYLWVHRPSPTLAAA